MMRPVWSGHGDAPRIRSLSATHHAPPNLTTTAALPTNLTSSHAKQSLLEKIGYTGDSKVDILDAAQGMESVSFDDFLGAPWSTAPHRTATGSLGHDGSDASQRENA